MEFANVPRNLVGPVLGGLLADPAINYPSIIPTGSMWTAYPFLLPNLAVAFLQISSFLLAFFFLEETHPQLTKEPDLGLRLGRAIAAIFTSPHSSTTGRERRYD